MGLTYKLQSDYNCALVALNKALELDPDNLWALSTKSEALCDIAEYQAALEVLDHAMQLGPPGWQTLYTRGWALENLGAEQAQDAKQAYEAALNYEIGGADNLLWTRKGIANTLRLLGDAEAAAVEYQWVIDNAEERAEVDVDVLALMGWCHYCIGEYDEAVRLFIETLSIDSDAISTQFDLALAFMCSGRQSLALREYQRGLELTQEKQARMRRGLLYVAIDDMEDAVKIQPPLAEVEEAQKGLKLLKNAFEEATSPAAATPVDYTLCISRDTVESRSEDVMGKQRVRE